MFEENNKSKIETDIFSPTQKYQAVMSAIKEVPDMRIITAEKVSVAWLIERLKQIHSLGWQKEVDGIEKTIRDLNTASGKYGVSHYLKEKINEEYDAFLNEELEKSTDAEEKENLEFMKKFLFDSTIFAAQAKAQHSAVSFGGVALDYAPEWYYVLPKDTDEEK
ncbi:hypothetical protein HYW94_01655 [Candidatus Uhrbacteria bacterium]|nr:hypothetical protein [Candidatus Uhrbacteria bacterium]